MNLFLALLLAAAAASTKPAPPPDLTTPPADAQKLPDGLVMKQLAPGSGSEHPSDTDLVHIKYAVWRAPLGLVVDYTRSGTTFVAMSKLLPGMREMFEKMSPGEKDRAWIPSSLGGGKILEDEAYVVDAELVDIVHPPAAPADVAAPSNDATITPSGLAYKVLVAGKGTTHPKKRDTVVVDYTGWTTDGAMFDSSTMRGEPAEFRLDAVIPGWTEGVQLMTEGEKVRFWIPEKLAYKGRAGAPQGMLVFDVELIKIK